jgi:transposase
MEFRAVIPLKEDQKGKPGRPADFDRKAYRQRNVAERGVGWLKECRAIRTRFDKLAVNFLAMRQSAMIKKYLNMQSSDRA